MAEISVQLAKSIKSVKIMDNYRCDSEPSVNITSAEQVKLAADLKSQKDLYTQVCSAIQNLTEKLNQLYENIFVERSEDIARLSVEIARRILMRKVQDGDYKIEAMVQEILKNAPVRQDLVVRLNPKDLASCQKIQQDTGTELFPGVRLVADGAIGQAECVLESPKGIIKSLIDEHLEQIGKALNKAE